MLLVSINTTMLIDCPMSVNDIFYCGSYQSEFLTLVFTIGYSMAITYNIEELL